MSLTTRFGSNCALLLPCPSAPALPHPNVNTSRSDRNMEWLLPHAMALMLRPVTVASSSGCKRSFESPRPSWPSSLSPHA